MVLVGGEEDEEQEKEESKSDVQRGEIQVCSHVMTP